MTKIVDLRSDTVTRPTPAMRTAMMEAAVGDVVYDEDPTVKALEARISALLGTEAALFVPSGTMANTIAIRLCADSGDEVLTDAQSHPVFYEAGGSCAFSGVLFKTIPGNRGILDADQVRQTIYSPIWYRPRQRAVLLENTHNRGGGSIYPIDTVAEISSVARENGLRVHMDGARLWNASVATGIPMNRYAAYCDTVSVCFSKGLGAPVGSALCGSRHDIERAWHYRHMLGGSWRQAGILAGGALYAMDHHVERLAIDHKNAALLARGLSQDCGLELLYRVDTNMIFFRHDRAEELELRLRERGVLVSAFSPSVVRCVTHLDVDENEIGQAIEAVKKVL